MTRADWSYDSIQNQAFSSFSAARPADFLPLESGYPIDVNCTFHSSTFLTKPAQLNPSRSFELASSSQLSISFLSHFVSSVQLFQSQIPASHYLNSTPLRLSSKIHHGSRTPRRLSLSLNGAFEDAQSLQIDVDELVKKLRDAPHNHRGKHTGLGHSDDITPYSSRYSSKTALTKYKIPLDGAPADAVHQMLKDELDLDGRPNLNLASFVGTYMEHEAEQLMIENLSKNMSDVDEYPAMMDMHARCVSILADLWGVQKGEKPIGTSTTGSSEAIHLGGLAMKRRWQEKRMKEGKDTSKPNIIMGANAQVALEKFARYFEVEARILPVSEESRHRLDPKLVKENLDENTIGVFVILGSTYTGHYEPVEEISNILDEFEKVGDLSD